MSIARIGTSQITHEWARLPAMRNVFLGIFLALVAHDLLNAIVQLLLTLHR